MEILIRLSKIASRKSAALAVWLAGWLSVWLAGWLAAGWLPGCLAGWWLAGLLAGSHGPQRTTWQSLVTDSLHVAWVADGWWLAS